MYAGIMGGYKLVQGATFFKYKRNKRCFNTQCTFGSSVTPTLQHFKFKTCTRCHGAFYCSTKCQRIDFETHRNFCHSPALYPDQKLLRPSLLSRAKCFIANIVCGYLMQTAKEELAREFRTASTTGDTEFILTMLILSETSFNPWKLQPFRGSELEKAYSMGDSKNVKGKNWIGHPQVLRVPGMDVERSEEEMMIHLDITVQNARRGTQYRIHALISLSLLAA
ncbi:hypothetical protein DL96DRAFT_628163 [Flagelloscypha sp. PMI_526]|nr:hypothetical protein DL96DRAFT_628163 [Flagelloscypha sp. PMI_526]